MFIKMAEYVPYSNDLLQIGERCVPTWDRSTGGILRIGELHPARRYLVNAMTGVLRTRRVPAFLAANSRPCAPSNLAAIPHVVEDEAAAAEM
jgi:hypothetical protein